jgi:hypothetical protein
VAIVVEGTSTLYESASTTSAVLTYPSGITAGEVLVALIGTSTVTAPSTAPSGWTVTLAQNGNNAISASIFHKVATGSETGTVTFTGTSGRTTGIMFRLSGVDTTTPIDATAVGAGAPIQSTFTMPSITTATNGAMLIHNIVLNSSNPATNDIITLSGTTLINKSTGTGRLTGGYYEERATAGATGTRVWSKTNAGTTLQWAGVTAAFRPGSSGPAVPVLNRCVQGIPTTTTHTIKVNTTNATSVRIKAGTNSAVTTGVVYGSAVTPDGNSNSELTITGLTANTPYFYRIAMTDSGATETLDTWTDVGQFKTDVNGQMDFSFGFGSCTNNTDSASLGAIAVKKPDLFFHLGDEYYADASGTSVANFRTKMGDKLSVTNHKAVYRTSGATWLPSDHDGMNNNGNYAADNTAWTNWNQVYREMKPTDGLPGSMGVYRTFKRGRIRFIAIDRRSFAVAAGNTDNSSKTCLGTTQKQWFKDQITNATEPVIVVINSDPWIITTDAGDDGWGGYITERDELATFISNSGKNVAFLAGDMHAVAAEDGSGAPGGTATFQAAPFYQNASIKGGPYDVGPYPASGTAVVQQYGWMDVVDTGTQISLVFKGFSSDNTQRVTLTKNYSVPQTATVAAVAATATATDIVPVVTGAVTVAHIKASATSQEGTPVVSAASVVVGVRAQASSLAVSPSVTTLGAVAGVTATATALALAPAVSGQSTAGVTAVVATGTALASPPAVTTLGAVAAVRAQGSSTAIAPAVSNGAGGGNTYNLYTTTPQIAADGDTASVNLGTEFYVTATAWVTQVRYLQPSSGGTSTSRVATIYSTTNGTTGTAVAGPFTIPAGTAGTWSTYTLPTPFQLTANTRYRIAIRHPDGRYAATGNYFTNGDGDPTVTQGILVVPNKFDALGGLQGSYVYDAGNVFPNAEFSGASYYSDVTIVDTNPSAGGTSTSAPRMQGSSTAVAPVVGGGFTVFAVTASGSSVAIAPSFSGGATTTAVRAQGSSLAVAPAVSGAQTITAVRAQASSLALAPTLANGHVLSAPAATATATGRTPVVGGGYGLTAVVATATATDYAPSVTSAVTITTPAALATATDYAPTVTAGSSVVAVRATATSQEGTPVVTAGAVVVAAKSSATGDVLNPAVTVIAGAVAASPTMLGSAMMRVPGVVAQGVANVTAVRATGTAAALAPVYSSPVTVGAPKAAASTSTPDPTVGASTVVQSVKASASAQAHVPAFAIIATVLALRMVATATDRTPSVSAASLAYAVVALATAVARTPRLGGDAELYLKDGTRVRPFMLIGGILVPVDPQF